jgi:cytochrome c oxidase cbb3-type subunit 1
MILYFVGLSWGGWIQGLELNDPDIPFLDIVAHTLPWLVSRSVAALVMTAGHVVFALLVWRQLTGRGPAREDVLQLGADREEVLA